jgi:pectate lyase
MAKVSIVTTTVMLLSGTAAALATDAQAAPIRYEAENSPATCAGSIDSNHAGFSGSGFCNGDNAVGAAVQFTVTSTSEGTATVGVRYANGSTTNRPADIIVNGTLVRADDAFAGTGAWTTWLTRSFTVPVNAGANTIRVSPTTSVGLANVDHVDVELGDIGTPTRVPAFPGAVGFGADASGGRGGEVYHVTNLNDSGPGSFRDAVSGERRTVVFDVGGYIQLASPLSIRSNITVAGQAAPGDGVAVRGYQVSLSNATNVIVRYMRFRHGLTPNQNRDSITINEGSNQIFDHVSVSWGRDENFSINNSTNVTVQNSIISEGLDPHSCGGLIQSDGVTIYRTLYAHNKTRNPKVKVRNQFVNNVVYNWGSDAYIEGDSAGRTDANVIGNYFIKGPSTGSAGPFTRGNLNFHIHAAGNFYDDDRDGAVDGRPTTASDLGEVVVEPAPFPFPPIAASSAAAAYQAVVDHAGASLRRDAVDRRVIMELTGQRGAIITDPAAVGGFGALAGGTAPADSDRDGMPDTWERANGLDPADAADGRQVHADGYTNVERYLNSLVR